MLITAAGAARIATAGESLAPAAAVDARQKGFKQMGAAMKHLNEQLGNAGPDPAALQADAAAIAENAAALPGWFPDGSGAAAGFKTDALDYVWQNRAKFDSLAGQLLAESRKLADGIGDPSAARAQVKVVGQTCKACHMSFRAD
ncbi:MAG: cytochrome c [Solimonas sp.]